MKNVCNQGPLDGFVLRLMPGYQALLEFRFGISVLEGMIVLFADERNVADLQMVEPSSTSKVKQKNTESMCILFCKPFVVEPPSFPDDGREPSVGSKNTAARGMQYPNSS